MQGSKILCFFIFLTATVVGKTQTPKWEFSVGGGSAYMLTSINYNFFVLFPYMEDKMRTGSILLKEEGTFYFSKHWGIGVSGLTYVNTKTVESFYNEDYAWIEPKTKATKFIQTAFLNIKYRISNGDVDFRAGLGIGPSWYSDKMQFFYQPYVNAPADFPEPIYQVRNSRVTGGAKIDISLGYVVSDRFKISLDEGLYFFGTGFDFITAEAADVALKHVNEDASFSAITRAGVLAQIGVFAIISATYQMGGKK